MRAHGHVFKYGDNVDTDVIIPARYLNSFDAQELASHAMADIDLDFKRLSRFPKNLGFDSSPFKKCRIFLSILHFLHDKPLINYTFKISFTISFILSESHSLLCLI